MPSHSKYLLSSGKWKCEKMSSLHVLIASASVWRVSHDKCYNYGFYQKCAITFVHVFFNGNFFFTWLCKFSVKVRLKKKVYVNSQKILRKFKKCSTTKKSETNWQAFYKHKKSEFLLFSSICSVDKSRGMSNFSHVKDTKKM